MKKNTKKTSANLRKHRKKLKFGGMQKVKKKDPSNPHKKPSTQKDALKINLPFEEAMKVVTSPKHKK